DNLSFSDCVRDLAQVICSFSTPPVLLAMNLGALMALKASEQTQPSALILVSPSPPGNLAAARSRPQRLLWLNYRLLIILHRPFRIDDKDFRAFFLSPLPENLQTALSRQTAPDSSALVREFLAPRVSLDPPPLSYPMLALSGSDDEMMPAVTTKRMSEWL